MVFYHYFIPLGGGSGIDLRWYGNASSFFLVASDVNLAACALIFCCLRRLSRAERPKSVKNTTKRPTNPGHFVSFLRDALQTIGPRTRCTPDDWSAGVAEWWARAISWQTAILPAGTASRDKTSHCKGAACESRDWRERCRPCLKPQKARRNPRYRAL